MILQTLYKSMGGSKLWNKLGCIMQFEVKNLGYFISEHIIDP
jgi:hypothetical protein